MKDMNLEVCRDDIGAVVSVFTRGHVDLGQFAEKVFQEYGVAYPGEKPHHSWWRWIPMNDPDYPGAVQAWAAKACSRGAFPVTEIML